jgi:hypothetical protein
MDAKLSQKTLWFSAVTPYFAAVAAPQKNQQKMDQKPPTSSGSKAA